MSSEHEGSTEIERLVVAHRDDLLAFVRRKAGGALLRLETAEDLTQGVCAHALARGAQSGDERRRQRAWLFKVAENFLRDRRDHWSALKRLGSGVMRATFDEARSGEFEVVRDLASSVTGPSTFAARRELLRFAAVALDMLLPRDRQLIDGYCRGASIEEQARELELSYDATSQARTRAIERFRRCFKLALRGQGAA